MGWDTHHPLERTWSLEESIFSAVCLRQNKLPFCWMFAYCLLWAWLVPWWSSPSKAAKLVSLCLNSLSPVLLSECWLNQTQPAPGSLLLFWSDIPSVELSPHSDWICVCIQMQDWPERDPRLNAETEMKDGCSVMYDSPSLMRIRFNLTAEGLHRQWVFVVLCSI